MEKVSRRSKSWDIDKVGRNKTGELGIFIGLEEQNYGSWDIERVWRNKTGEVGILRSLEE